MLFTPLGPAGAMQIDLDAHADDRGFFARTFCAREFEAQGLPGDFPQCNLSHNARAGTLRGVHYNHPPFEEAKLVRCVRGAVYDVIVDLRPGSPTHLEWVGIELSAENGRAVFVPKGFAHGFVTLSDATDVFYHMDSVFQPNAARGFRYNDPSFKIQWPIAPRVISERDASYPDFDPTSWGARDD
ncbi:MAG TPA: dTDP-4-dehydrorhamnose 3,5-epimerase [Polyangiaceae bacterium]